MADDPQSLPPEPVSVESTANTPKPRWPLSRIILFGLLAVSVGLLGFDFLSGSIPQNKAYQLLDAKLPGDEPEKTEAGKAPIGKRVELLTPDDVHKLLDRLPDATETDPNRIRQLMQDPEAKADPKVKNDVALGMVETYSYRGAFRRYVLNVGYMKNSVKNGGQSYVMLRLAHAKE